MTAGELRAMLEDVPDDLPVVAADTLTGPRRAVTGVWYDEAGPVLRSVADLLNELANLGFAWRDIAQLIGVTVPAVRKWRQGEPATGAHRRAVARLLAFADVLRSDHLVSEVSSWMEIPLAGSSTTGIDVYSQGGEKALLLHAAGHLSSEELLDNIDPSWRDAFDDRFEVRPGNDGEPIIFEANRPRAEVDAEREAAADAAEQAAGDEVAPS